ncbi:MAG: hypothetical protein WEB04_12130 [Dehalococcoidia bacterium]
MRLGIIVVMAVTTVVVTIATLSSVDCTKTSTKDVEERITRELPLGSTSAEVISWLGANEIQHYGPRDAGEYSELRSRGIPPTSQVIEGFIGNTGFEGIFTTKNIEIFFVLTEDGRLREVIVTEGRTAL